MKKLFTSIENLSKRELCLWGISSLVVTAAFLLSGGSLLSLVASLIGVTALIFTAKGDVLGQLLMVVFSLLYAVISLRQRYYGEMITYLCMTAPVAALAVAAWLRHPFEGGRGEVEVNRVGAPESVLMLAAAAVVTVVFYYILAFFNTANLVWSTASIATSFIASYLTFRRSPLYALGYAVNDCILIVLWVSAALGDRAYAPMAFCFAIFLVNDIYGFVSWRAMQKRQSEMSKSTNRTKNIG